MEPLSQASQAEPPRETDPGHVGDPPATVEWYHPDPDAPYRELRLGATPGLSRALLVSGGLAVGMIALMLIALWIGWLRNGSAMPIPN